MYSSLISTEDLANNYSNSWVICDCRFTLTDPELGRAAYGESHITNSIYIDLEADLSSPITAKSGRHPLPEVEEFCVKLGQWGIDSDTQVVVYDDSFGSIAARMWWLLRWLGHEKVAVLDGGWQKWKREERGMDNIVTQAKTKGPYPYALQNQLTVEAESLLNLDDKFLVDARAEERFSGNIEPFDKVAGHIPGAINIPFEDNLDIDGTFLKGDELKEIYRDKGLDDQYDKLILMCGSGVTACHSVVALAAANVGIVQLYPGSWSEWITDDSRPVATGEE